MEATKQTENLFRTWTARQMRVWDGWLDAVQTTGGSSMTREWEQMRRITLDAWEDSAMKTLDAQAEWWRGVSETIPPAAPANDASGDRTQLVQTNELIHRWTDAQKQLWRGWFQMARQLDLSKVAGDWERAFETWQEAFRRTVEGQFQWLGGPVRPAPARPKAAARETAAATAGSKEPR